MGSTVIRGNEADVVQAPWGSLQWLVSGKDGSSEHMTFGRVTFRPGCSNPTHHHPNCEEILFVVSGEVEHSLPEGGTTVLRAGDCIVLPSGKGHQARNVGDEEAVVVVVFNSAQRETVGE